jgi:cytochrome c biogenesis protein CcdA/thiol-disulfide isomerase/thioredoxin
MYSLALISFIAWVLTVFAPCILPVLPVILAWSIGENNKRYAYVVTSSLAISIVLFTILLKASTVLLGVPPGVWTYISWGVVLFLGLTYIFPRTWAIVGNTAWFSVFQANLQKTTSIDSGLLRWILTWAALWPVFSSCSPTYSLLLATVFPVSLIEWTIYTMIYAIWLSLMLLLIARWWQKVIQKIRPFANENWIFRKVLWFILVFVSLMILTGFDKIFELRLLSGFNITNIEQSILEKVLPWKYSQDYKLPINTNNSNNKNIPELALDGTITAPWLNLPDWINSKPLTLSDLKWKVVILDFWTYSCINCQRTLPYMVALDKAYRDKWLLIIWVHSPEFSFEHLKSNVEKAVNDAWIKYPVVLDNNFDLWNAYNNQYWPAKYFIDRNWKLRHYHFGEWWYEETEKVVQYLLSENSNESFSWNVSVLPSLAFTPWQSPETYLGTARRDNMVNSSNPLSPDQWMISWKWEDSAEYITSSQSANLTFNYSAKDVYLVLSWNWNIKISVDWKPLNELGIEWKDSKNSMITVDSDKMYNLVHEKSFQKWRILKLEFSPGIKAYAFTFWW